MGSVVAVFGFLSSEDIAVVAAVAGAGAVDLYGSMIVIVGAFHEDKWVRDQIGKKPFFNVIKAGAGKLTICGQNM
ncbi:hypothetical protein [Parasitella parasitica]|uniref:Uncharacterized protein n=1 Tax=Parasitella parasitica TaxID=35722 RepID=A0A0B7NWI7_9FUNG|nr:hypothetical protein [Parasitella parasitica]